MADSPQGIPAGAAEECTELDRDANFVKNP